MKWNGESVRFPSWQEVLGVALFAAVLAVTALAAMR